MPPLRARARIISSVVFRAWFAMTRLDECDAIIGALVVSIASKNVLSATCEMSTITPSRFISRTTSLPKVVRRCGPPAFHAHQRSDLVIRGRLSHIRGGRREHQIAGMRADRFAHGVDLIERALHGRRTGDIARHPDREEQRVQASLAHARDVMAVSFQLPRRKATIG